MSWEWTEQQDIQGTDAWRRARAKRLGGSEIASVLRISPYKTRRDLWSEKSGRKPQADISNLPHVRRGIDAEPIARAKIESLLGTKYTTPVVKHKRHAWAVASLDGLSLYPGREHILEIKTMSKDKHQEVAWGIIPDYYECQLQWNMMIAERDRCLFASYRPEDESLYWFWVDADRTEQTYIMERAVEFWSFVEQDTPPPDEELEILL